MIRPPEVASTFEPVVSVLAALPCDPPMIVAGLATSPTLAGTTDGLGLAGLDEEPGLLRSAGTPGVVVGPTAPAGADGGGRGGANVGTDTPA